MTRSLHPTFRSPRGRSIRALVLASAAALALSACRDSGGLDAARAYKPIPQATLALMAGPALAVQPTVNTLGQTVGSIINVQA